MLIKHLKNKTPKQCPVNIYEKFLPKKKEFLWMDHVLRQIENNHVFAVGHISRLPSNKLDLGLQPLSWSNLILGGLHPTGYTDNCLPYTLHYVTHLKISLKLLME